VGMPITRVSNGEARVREDRFTTRCKDRADQFPYWRDLLAPVAEAERTAAFDRGFRASVRAHDMGALHIASVHVDAMKYRRTSQHIRRTEIDHWQLVLRKRGTEVSRSGNCVLRSTAGSLDLRSYGHPSISNASTGSLICIWMSRDNFSTLSGAIDAANHTPFRGAMKNILEEFILSLDRHRASLTVQDVPDVVRSFTALFSAAIRPTRQGFDEASMPISASLFELARKHINANLSSPTLSADSLCRELSISRRKLYYLFERCGGVASFIRQRRLAASHIALETGLDQRRISTIAYDHGFTDPAQFSRLFRAQYGYSPKEAREARMFGSLPDHTAPKTFAEWLLQVRDK